MKKTFILLFSLLPSLIYSQITVADGTDIGADIDSQESTTMYVGAFYAPTTIWDDYSGYVKHYQIMLVLEEGTEGSVIYSENYPDGDPALDPPELPYPYTVYIHDEDIAGGPYTQFEPGKTYHLDVTAYATYGSIEEVARVQSDGVLILGGEEPPEEPEDEPPVGAGRITLSATPPSLSFAAGETARSQELRITAAGSGPVTIQSIREKRISFRVRLRNRIRP
jgi:hypothetical protein